MIKYKYNENKALVELEKYINSTYDEHYSKNKFQATEFIIDGGHGEGFCIGNIMKYAQRYGKKNGKDRSCLLYTSPSPRDGLLSRMPSSA